jgi:small subunit ribosomal protein S17
MKNSNQNIKERKNSKKRLHGIVVSDKTSKTRVVETEKLVRHPLYQKALKKKSKFYAHDEKEVSKSGDAVIIEECRSMSKLKRWRVIEVKK